VEKGSEEGKKGRRTRGTGKHTGFVARESGAEREEGFSFSPPLHPRADDQAFLDPW